MLGTGARTLWICPKCNTSLDFFGALAFIIMTDFRVRSLGKCLYFPLHRRRRKVLSQRYSTFILQSQTYVRLRGLRRRRRPSVREASASARYPNYVAAVEQYLRAILRTSHAPMRLPGHNLTISTKGDASKASANADPRHLGDTMLVSCISTTGSLNFILTSQWWFSLMFCLSPFIAQN